MSSEHGDALIPRAARYDSLDVWRGVACLAVVVWHVAGHDRRIEGMPEVFTKLWLGVPMFFVISGYCIAATCDAARRRERSFGWYMWRRVRRIYPPYWVCLGITATAAAAGVLTVGAGISHPSELTTGQWAGNLTLTERWRPRLFGDDQQFVLATAWTLCYEEQFYLICGLLLVAARRNFYMGVMGVTVLAMPLTVLNWSGITNLQGFFLDGYWYQFAAGVLVYHGRNYAGPRGWRVHVGFLFAVVVVAAALRLALPRSLVHGFSRASFLDGTIFAFAFAAVLLLLQGWDARITSAAVLSPLRACGTMCYSLYLTHLPVINGVRRATDWLNQREGSVGVGAAVATVLCAVVAGACFHRLIERHFLNSPAN